MTNIELNTMKAAEGAAQQYPCRTVAPDWEQRRYEIARGMLCALQGRIESDDPVGGGCALAIEYADELIRQLKGGQE